MCKFFSFIVVRGNAQAPVQYLWRWFTDSHAEILACCQMDDSSLERLDKAKCEFAPDVPDDIIDPTKWTLTVDEATRPDWFDSDVEAAAIKWATSIVKSRTITSGKRRGIYDGWWIVGKDAIVENVGGGTRLIHVGGSAQITDVGGSAQITNVRGSAQITDVGGSAQITNVWGSAQITDVGGSAQITNVWGSAQITNVWGSAQITNVWGSALITDVGDSATLDKSAKTHVKEVP